MEWYYPMIPFPPAPVPEGIRQPVPSQPQPTFNTSQDIQTPMYHDSLVFRPPSLLPWPGYSRRAMMTRFPSFMRAKQPFLSSRPLTTPVAHFNVSGLPSGIPTYTPGRPPRHSSLPAPPTVQLPWLSLQPLVRPIFYDPISTITQTPTQPSRRHSIALPPQPPLQANHHNYFFSVPKISVPVDFHPLSVPFPPANAYHVSELTPRGQETSAFPHVRFSERNLIIPSQISMREPRKGWHNRRGDQLWTSKGHYKPAPPGQEYPPDLTNYPDYGEGWMNEEGVRIDMQHRLIPKAPLRSALKRPSQVSIADANPRTWVVHD